MKGKDGVKAGWWRIWNTQNIYLLHFPTSIGAVVDASKTNTIVT